MATTQLILPAAAELVWGSLVLLLMIVPAGLVAWDLRRRRVATWWAIALATFLLLPVGLVGWALVRSRASAGTEGDATAHE